MTVIEVFCIGRPLHTGDAGIEHSHHTNRVVVRTFQGEAGTGWDSIGDHPGGYIAQLAGDEYLSGRRSGELGAAEAAKRFGEPTDEQARMLGQPTRQNVNMECEVCGQKLTRHRDDLDKGLDWIAAASAPSDAAVPVSMQMFANILTRVC